MARCESVKVLVGDILEAVSRSRTGTISRDGRAVGLARQREEARRGKRSEEVVTVVKFVEVESGLSS